MANESIGTIRGTIEIDYDGAGIVRAVRDTDKLKRSGTDLDKSMSGVLKTFGKFAKAGALVAASSVASQAGLQAVATTLAIIGPLAAAGAALLPTIFAGAAAAAIVMKVATAGMGNALKAASGDATKFNEAIKDLPPQAQAFARAYRASLPALQAVQKAIQNAFFRGLGPELTRTVSRVRSLQPAAVGVAGAFNGIIRQILQWARSNQAIAAFNAALRIARGILVNMDGAIKPFLNSIAGLVVQARMFADDVGGGIGGALQTLAGWIRKIDLRKTFDAARPVVKVLSDTLKNLMSIAGSLFSVFSKDGGDAGSVLSELTGKLAAFLKSAQGQQALQAIGQMMNAIATGSGQVFMALLKALAPAIIALAPAITSLANTASSLLVPALGAAAPILEAIAGWISDNTMVVGPLVAALVGMAAAYKAVTAVTNAWKTAEAVAQTLRLKSIASWAVSTASTIANTAATAANAAVRGGAFVASWIASTAAMVAQRAAMVAQVAIMAVIRGATIAWTAVQWLLNAALLANPIGLVIVAIVALIAIIVLIATKTKWFQTIWKVVWTAVKAMAQATWNAIRTAASAFINGVRAVISAGLNVIRAVWTTIFNTIRAVASAIWSAIVAVIRGYINTVLAVIRGIQAVIGILRSAFDRARAAVATALNTLIGVVRGIPGRVVSALGNLGGLLVNAGRNLISGFVNGIKDKIGDAINAVKNGIGAIGRLLPGSPAKEGPLSGRGYVMLRGRRMMADMAKGMASKVEVVRQVAKRSASVAAQAVPPSTPRPATDQQLTRTIAVPQSAAVRPLEVASLTVNLQGIWDMRDPQATRKIAADVHKAVENLKKGYQ